MYSLSAGLSRTLMLMSSSSSSAGTRIRQLWIPASPGQLQKAEEQVLSKVKTPFTQTFTDIGNGQLINTIHFSQQQQQQEKQMPSTHSTHSSHSINNTNPLSPLSPISSSMSPVVLLHGFGAGVGLYYGNFDHLASFIPELYAIDMLGWGRSSRTPFKAKNTDEAEEFFISSIEHWRISNKLNRITLAGHSLGGYIAATYAMRFPQHVDRLILISPVGVPERPADQPQSSSSWVRASSAPSLPVHYRVLRSTIRNLWQWGLTPQHIIRVAGPYGKGLIESYVTNRFSRSANTAASTVTLAADGDADHSDLDLASLDIEMDKPALSEYIYQMLVASGSGEYALAKLLGPDVFAHHPLSNRLPVLTTQSQQIPTTFIYGQHDWMDVRAGIQTMRIMRQQGGQAQVIKVKDAGHQIMTDNAQGFYQAMVVALKLNGEPENQEDSGKQDYKHLIVTT